MGIHHRGGDPDAVCGHCHPLMIGMTVSDLSVPYCNTTYKYKYQYRSDGGNRATFCANEHL
jgi:hypothetical protein